MRTEVKDPVGSGYGTGSKTTIASSAVAAAFLWVAAPTPLRAQATLNDAIGARAERARTGQDRLLVDAKEIVYNNDKNTDRPQATSN